MLYDLIVSSCGRSIVLLGYTPKPALYQRPLPAQRGSKPCACSMPVRQTMGLNAHQWPQYAVKRSLTGGNPVTIEPVAVMGVGTPEAVLRQARFRSLITPLLSFIIIQGCRTLSLSSFSCRMPLAIYCWFACN